MCILKTESNPKLQIVVELVVLFCAKIQEFLQLHSTRIHGLDPFEKNEHESRAAYEQRGRGVWGPGEPNDSGFRPCSEEMDANVSSIL